MDRYLLPAARRGGWALLCLVTLLAATVACGGASTPQSTDRPASPTETTDGGQPVATEPTTQVPTPQPTHTPSPSRFPDGWVLPAPWPDREIPPGVLLVDAAASLGHINPYLFGSNYGPWVFVPLEVRDEAAGMGLTLLRFPGGEWGDRNSLRLDDFDRFIEYARELGVEPTISVRLRDGTPEAAADLVRHANVERGYGLRYWSIGNEPNLYGDYTPEQFVADWRTIAEAMLAVDPSIILLGPEVSQYTGDDSPGPNDAHAYLDEFLRVNGDLVDVVTIHRYPFPGASGNRTITVEELRGSSAEWDRLIPDLRERIRRHTGRDLPVGVTEFNSAWTQDVGGEATPDSFANAVWLADVLGRLIRQQVDVANQFVLVSRDQQGGWGLLSDSAPRPSYYVYRLYRLFGDGLVFAGAGGPDVGVYAATRDDGALTIMAVNLGPVAADLTLSLAGHAGGAAEVYRLTAARVADGTADQPAETVELIDGAAVSLPPESVTLFIVPAGTTSSESQTTTALISTPATTHSTQENSDVIQQDVLPYLDPGLPTADRVADLLARMTTAEKIAQMTQVEKNSITPEAVAELGIGSVLSGGGGNPTPNTPDNWAAMVRDFQEGALQSRLAVPLIYGVDAVHGHNNVRGATIFPHTITLGAADDPDLVRRVARATALETAATGVRWDFAPMVAVVQDIRWGRTYESFGDDTATVAELGRAFLLGLQDAGDGLGLASPHAVLSTPKHFVGDGATVWDTSTREMLGVRFRIDQGDMRVDEATLREVYLPPYTAAVETGARSIMVSFSSWNGVKMHGHRYLLTDVLKGEMGFDGFLVSDWQAIDQIDPDFYTSVVTAINAGLDMVMVPYDYVRFMDTLSAAVAAGDVPMARIDDAVTRILRVKFEMGLFERPFGDPADLAFVGAAEHRALAREAAARGMVLLRNENNTLPIPEEALIIFVAGEGADDIGLQSGGWTIKWQGGEGAITDGTTLLDGIKAAAGPETRVQFNRFGKYDRIVDGAGNPLTADVGIVVIAEKPYAEGLGDREDLNLTDEQVALIERVRARSRQVVVVLVTGRPLIITEHLPLADAWVAAWLPGSEGGALGDVLFGHLPFTGHLPLDWPRSMADIPDGEALFPRGHGLATNGG